MNTGPKTSIEFYDKVFSSGALREPDYYYDWIIELLDPDKGRNLLDIACGAGLLLKATQMASLEAVGLDISITALKESRNLVPTTDVVLGNADILPFPSQTFDYVTCLGSLEHFLHPKESIKEMARVLKKGGRAIIVVPNAYFIKDLYMVWRKGDFQKHGQIIDRYATREEWKTLLEGGGLSVQEIRKYNPRWKIISLGRLIYRICRPLIPLNLSYHFVFICSRK